MGITTAIAQVKVGNNPTVINANAVLDIESTNKGMLLPRVALTGTGNFAPLSAHVAGMSVYNTATAGNVTPGYYYNDGTKWVRTLSSDVTIYNSDGSLAANRIVSMNSNTLNFSGISTLGTSGVKFTTTGGGYLGIDNGNVPAVGNVRIIADDTLELQTSGNAYQLNLLPNGNVGIGTSSPGGQLEVAGIFNSPPLLVLNQTNTSWASAATFNAFRYIRTNFAGVQSNGNVKQFNVGAGGVSIGYPNTPVFLSSDALYVNGNVGIGTATPTETLDVAGNVRFSNALMPNNLAGTAGQVLTSAGAGVAPTWGTVAGPVNIYNSDGLLATNRIVGMNSNTLTFSGVLGQNSAGVRFTTGFGSTLAIDNGNTGRNTRLISADTMEFQTGANVYQLNLLPNGNVGIARIAPSVRLDVEGAFRAGGNITAAATAGNVTDLYGSYMTWNNTALTGFAAGGATNFLNNRAGGSLGGFTFTGTSDNTTLTEFMRINGNTGHVGIGTPAPTQALDVAGSVRFSNALMPNNDAGAIGEVLVSAGASVAPIWTPAASWTGLWKNFTTTPANPGVFVGGTTNRIGTGGAAAANNITVPTTGFYKITLSSYAFFLSTNGITSGTNIVQYFVNGVAQSPFLMDHDIVQNDAGYTSVAILYKNLSAGDQISIARSNNTAVPNSYLGNASLEVTRLQ